LKIWANRYFDNKEQIAISEAHLVSIKDFISKEFKRDPRDNSELPRWKAIEESMALMYTGPVVFKKTLNEQTYKSFMKLHTAVRRLYLSIELETAQLLLQSFVDDFGTIFPEKKLSYTRPLPSPHHG
jgi:hypothetical protein